MSIGKTDVLQWYLEHGIEVTFRLTMHGTVYAAYMRKLVDGRPCEQVVAASALPNLFKSLYDKRRAMLEFFTPMQVIDT